MSIMDAVKLMRGPKGSPIRITIMRDEFEKPKEFSLVREIIKIRSVKARTLEDGYGYVRLAQFQERTDEELAKALKELRKENNGQIKGLLLDLRNNPGGLLEQAVKVSDAFLGQGMIVYTDGREEGSHMEFHARPGVDEEGFPMVVLINGGSASASEIVAGALQDHDRAIILGTQSFGKGSVQTVIPLSDDSGLRVTTARYYTPQGASIQARGITPDIAVPPAEVKKVNDAEHFREEDLVNHFETAKPEKPPAGAPQTRKFDLQAADRDDYQLMRALDLLKGWHIFKDLKEKTPSA
jgi:carboxyl-terminal processing protease